MFFTVSSVCFFVFFGENDVLVVVTGVLVMGPGLVSGRRRLEIGRCSFIESSGRLFNEDDVVLVLAEVLFVRSCSLIDRSDIYRCMFSTVSSV